MPQKTLIMLIGPKGSGKTTIGRLLAEHLPVRFLSVEPLWTAYLSSPVPGKTGWEIVEDAIAREFEKADRVIIESLGAGEEFGRFRDSLRAKYLVKMVRVHAPLEECLRRVKERDPAGQIAVPLEKVDAYNRVAIYVKFDWSLHLHNHGSLPSEEMVRTFQSWLEGEEILSSHLFPSPSIEDARTAINVDGLLGETFPLWERLETLCVAGCCGIDAFDLSHSAIRDAAAELGAERMTEVLRSAASMILATQSPWLVSIRINMVATKEQFAHILSAMAAVLSPEQTR
jgi:shikimate kinase